MSEIFVKKYLCYQVGIKSILDTLLRHICGLAATVQLCSREMMNMEKTFQKFQENEIVYCTVKGLRPQ